MERAKVLAALLASEHRYTDAEVVYGLIERIESQSRSEQTRWVYDRITELEGELAWLKERAG